MNDRFYTATPNNLRARLPKPLKVRVVVEVEVDRDGWNREYGEGESAAEIRDQIKYRVNEAADETFRPFRSFITVNPADRRIQ